MSRPGVEIISRAQPLPRSAPTDTGVFFAVGGTEKGPAEPTLIHSLTEYEAIFGARSGGTTLYDAIEAYFREGGSRVYVSAVPTTPTVQSRVFDTGDTEKALADAQKQAEPAASESGDGTTKTKASTRSTPTPTDIATALGKFLDTYGPGQVAVPGVTDAATHAALLDHAAKCNRVALLDLADGDATALKAAGTALHSQANARYGAAFAPTAVIPGIAPGTFRSVPYSAIEAGLIARSDAVFNPNVPAAGDNGRSVYALDLAATYTGQEYEDLNEAGVDMARLVYGGVETYGYRTCVDPASQAAAWLSLGNARLNMAIVAQAGVIAERFLFRQIDGRRRVISQFGGELSAMLVPFYEAGALYGNTADEAFRVDVGLQVNTEATIAAGELHAVLEVRMSPFDELVVIEIVKVATTEALAA